MAERDLIQQLDRALTTPSAAGPEVTELLRVAAMVREMPTEAFRTELKARLQSRAFEQMKASEQEKSKKKEEEKEMAATTPATTNWLRTGFHSITSYLHVPRSAHLMEFLTAAFGAEEIMRVGRPDGAIMHAEIRLGDSILELAEDPPAPFGPRPVALHYYVPDVDEVYRRAVEAGATTLHALVDQPYGDREASIQDPAGNYWYVATHRGAHYVPDGLHSVTPYLHLRGAGAFIEFLKKAFAVEIVERHDGSDGAVAHAKVKLGDSVVELSEAHGQWQPMPASLHFYTPDVDAMYRRAIAAGATSIAAPADQPYGDRYAGVVDSQGNRWYLATHIQDVAV